MDVIVLKRPPLFGQNHIKTATVVHLRDGVLMWLARAKFILFRIFGAKIFRIVVIYIPIHFHVIYIGSSTPQITENCVLKLSLALWWDLCIFWLKYVFFDESFYGEFDISHEILLILENHIQAKVMSPIMQY